MEFFNSDDLKDSEIYLKTVKTSEGNPEKMYVPSYEFKICRIADDAELGECSLRIGHNENTYYGGNIGYEVYENFRGSHYAGKACKLLLKLAAKHNMEVLYITCSTENTASQKTCEYCGGKSPKTVEIPEWHDMYKLGRRKSYQYSIKLK